MKVMRFLITGGSGFIGTNIITQLVILGHEVLNIDINSPRNTKQNIYWQACDVRDLDSLHKKILNFNPDYIFHMAAKTDLDGKNINEYDSNTIGVKNLVKVIKELTRIKFVVFASSMLVSKLGYLSKNENDYLPDTLYGESKVIGEKIVKNSGLNCRWVIVRPTSIWGPWFDTPYRNFFDLINKKMYFHISGLSIERSYGFVDNIVLQLLEIIKIKELHGKSVYLTDAIPTKINQWADLISIDLHGYKNKSLPYFIFKVLALIGNLLKTLGFKNPPMTSFRLTNMTTSIVYPSIDRFISKKLEYKTLHDGVRITNDWLFRNK